MTRVQLAVLMLLSTLPLVACSPRSATTIYQRNPYACKYFRDWFQYIDGNVTSSRSGAASILHAAVTMASGVVPPTRGKLYRDVSRLQALVSTTTAAQGSPMLPVYQRRTMTAIRQVQKDCRA